MNSFDNFWDTGRNFQCEAFFLQISRKLEKVWKHQNFELFDSGLGFRHFSMFWNLVKKKISLKFNFTYQVRLPASDLASFIDFSYQNQNTTEFLAKSEFVAQHYILTIFLPFIPFLPKVGFSWFISSQMNLIKCIPPPPPQPWNSRV